MAIVLALPRLFDAVVARFAAESTTASNYFGWREVEKHQREANRIVWVPGDPGGALGDIVAPRNPGQNPRPLLNLEELFTCHVSTYDATAPEDELTQYKATRILFDAWARAVYKEAHGTFSLLSANWNTAQNTRRHGAEIVVVATIQAMIPDLPFDIAPVDTEGDITTSLEDVSEKSLEPEPAP